jgi:flavin reductase (DIM6/NTAB) family NADH-FMN oxidoreductase RutF
MSLVDKIQRQVRKALLGPTDLPLNIDAPLQIPQRETSVWLHGMGEPRDVTVRHSVACTSPFLVCIGFERSEFADAARLSGTRFSLKFCRNTPERELLAEIGLEFTMQLDEPGRLLGLFRAVSCANFCLSALRLRAHDLFNIHGNRKTRKFTGQDVSALEMRCNAVIYICPRPVVLVSVLDEERGNIFPMNLLGTLGGNYFGFALNSSRAAAPLANRVRRLALSSVPYRQIDVARELRKNHRQESICWEDLPFPTRRSKTLHIPAPEFALRVLEVNIEKVWPLGSHTFFLARIAGEEIVSDDGAFYMINGQYAAQRQTVPVPIPEPVPAR